MSDSGNDRFAQSKLWYDPFISDKPIFPAPQIADLFLFCFMTFLFYNKEAEIIQAFNSIR